MIPDFKLPVELVVRFSVAVPFYHVQEYDEVKWWMLECKIA